ncbi:MAG: hypothetical protein ACFFBL_10915 [Promethearchaeota archaeon]
MSELPDCPYCGAKVHTDRVLDYDNKIKLRCNNCGGLFEFLPGFGAFSLPEDERRGSIRHEGFRPHYEVYEADAPWGIESPPAQRSDCGAACFIMLCFCCIVPIFVVVLMLILGIGFPWF